ncbi:MAG: GTP cyclohydrolase 1 type 2 [Phycisphaerae bacterium]|nr:MAG: GTP cyclohydrolase 1 type 2 [Phycisphaerae bacterium]
MAKSSKQQASLVSDICRALETIAPLRLAQKWDNVGLLAGDANGPVSKALLCIDLTPEVATEAIKAGVDFVMAYHPPIFKPVARLTAQSAGPEAAIFRCIANGIAVYSMHTALDAADGGTNDVIANLCGITETEPLEYATPGASECKIVTFVPAKNVDAVANAMFKQGAGRIGDYEQCSYRIDGLGTFFGTEGTNPAGGRAGKLEHVDEIRLEVVCPTNRIPQVTAAMIKAHPYEEVAYDVYPTQAHPERGIGRVGKLPRAITLETLARNLKKASGAPSTHIVGRPNQKINRAVIVVGAAGSLPFSIPLGKSDVIITGEIRHHDALTILRKPCNAIALGHWSSERPTLKHLAKRLTAMTKGVSYKVSRADDEPFQPI